LREAGVHDAVIVEVSNVRPVTAEDHANNMLAMAHTALALENKARKACTARMIDWHTRHAAAIRAQLATYEDNVAL
jgi:hypothetical protein